MRTAWNKGIKTGIAPPNKGKPSPYRGVKRNPETGKKISLSKLGKKRKPFSSEWRKNMSRKWSEETRLKQVIAHSGERSGTWKGGISFENYPQDWNDSLRESVRQRDNYICQECGLHQDELSEKWYTRLDVHHIDYNKKNCNPDNLISLCRTCHIKTNYNREYWLIYFNR